MKVGQKTIVRWISERVAARGRATPHQHVRPGLRELSPDQLRHVGGGDGSAQSPGKTW